MSVHVVGVAVALLLAFLPWLEVAIASERNTSPEAKNVALQHLNGAPYFLSGARSLHDLNVANSAEKVAEIGSYFAQKMFYTQVSVLDAALFEQSVQFNGNTEQVYNYVVSNGKVYVATWSRIKDIYPRFKNCVRYPMKLGMMVDSGERAVRRHLDTCFVFPYAFAAKHQVSVTQAVSDHFMLAQRKGGIEDYLPERWIEKSVDFAGQIKVMKHKNGTYDYRINGHGSHYFPLVSDAQCERGNIIYLARIGRLFEFILSKPPNMLETWTTHHFEHEELRLWTYPQATNCLSRKHHLPYSWGGDKGLH